MTERGTEMAKAVGTTEHVKTVKPRVGILVFTNNGKHSLMIWQNFQLTAVKMT